MTGICTTLEPHNYERRSTFGDPYLFCVVCGGTAPLSAGHSMDGARTSAESRTQTETETETGRSTSSQTDALGRGRQSTAELRDIHPLDALAVTVAWIRPDWNITLLRAVLARCNGSHHELAERALRVALDPDARTPAAIENAGPIRRANVAQTYPGVDEALNPELDPHGFPVGACPVCRKGAA